MVIINHSFTMEMKRSRGLNAKLIHLCLLVVVSVSFAACGGTQDFDGQELAGKAEENNMPLAGVYRNEMKTNILQIDQTDPNKFDFSIEAYNPNNGNVGDIEGQKVVFNSETNSASFTADEDCDLTFSFGPNEVEIKQEGRCSGYAGNNVYFSGKYLAKIPDVLKSATYKREENILQIVQTAIHTFDFTIEAYNRFNGNVGDIEGKNVVLNPETNSASFRADEDCKLIFSFGPDIAEIIQDGLCSGYAGNNVYFSGKYLAEKPDVLKSATYKMEENVLQIVQTAIHTFDFSIEAINRFNGNVGDIEGKNVVLNPETNSANFSADEDCELTFSFTPDAVEITQDGLCSGYAGNNVYFAGKYSL